MSTGSDFPTTLDSFTNKVDYVDDILAVETNTQSSAIEGLEAKVGADSSAVTTSHDYLLQHTVNDSGNQSVDGIKTFGSFPVTPSSDPTTDYQVANKSYVDSQISSEDFWDRTGTTINPKTSGDDLDMGAGDVSATAFIGTLNTAAQPNITSVGTLTSLAVTGASTASNIDSTNKTDIGSNTTHRGLTNNPHSVLATQISDFDTEVSNNSSVTANTSKLSGIEAGAEVNNISDTNATDLTDGGASTLHYHASDRSRANHTGTQTAATISDFDTEVSNNSSVTTNTTHRGLTNNPHSTTKTHVGLSNVPNTDFTSAVGLNTTHRGLTNNPHAVDKADVGLSNVPNTDFTAAVGSNTTHRTSDGKNHSDVVTNNSKISYTDAAAVGLNTTHRTSNGTNHANVVTNNAKVTNANHSGEVTGSGALTIANNVVDEANLKLDSAATDGYVLEARAAESGGLRWVPQSGGGAIDDIFYENAQNVTANYTISTNYNAMSAGPITIDTGVTVTIPSGSVWSIV